VLPVAFFLAFCAAALLGAGCGWIIGRELGDTRGIMGWAVGALVFLSGIFYSGGM
jgi:hypothetical protein